MKLLRYGPKGQEKPGIVDAEGVVRDLSGLVYDIAGDVLTDQGLAGIAEADLSSLPAVEVDRYGPCVGGVGKFICIGLNYSDHAEESGLEVPPEPVIFSKAARSSSARTRGAVAAQDFWVSWAAARAAWPSS